ncbi:MAG: hypothetical protein A4E62_02636 [Syntrophorhabdus sp. PtaU1.Bin002]|nr:MAG: hypothetical protein A4E58_00250 [Syntrophorhabdus sp. PtaB.Bin006]OPY65655.1 MAG: hypothetical protein A4E62_02636 [Syntrophorhabdus sp. PtaU1.Bin002]
MPAVVPGLAVGAEPISETFGVTVKHGPQRSRFFYGEDRAFRQRSTKYLCLGGKAWDSMIFLKTFLTGRNTNTAITTITAITITTIETMDSNLIAEVDSVPVAVTVCPRMVGFVPSAVRTSIQEEPAQTAGKNSNQVQNFAVRAETRFCESLQKKGQIEASNDNGGVAFCSQRSCT